MPAVLIEVTPPDPPAELARAMVGACSSSLREGGCALADDEEAPAGNAVAIVRWIDAAEEHAEVQYGTRAGGSSAWRSRMLEFHDADAPAERWRAVGLTIATLAEETAQAEASSKAAAPEAPPNVDERPPRRRVEASAPASWFASVGAAVGTGVEEGPLRVGGFMDIAFRPGSGRTFLRLSGSHAVLAGDPQGLDVSWTGAALGVGVTLGGLTEGPALEPRLAVCAEYTRAWTSGGRDEEPTSGDAWGYGARAGFDFAWGLGRFSPAVGVESYVLRASTRVLVRGTPTAVSPASGFLALAGIRVRLD